MADKLLNFPNHGTKSYPICRLHLVVGRLNTQLNEPTNQNSIKITKVIKQTNKKT